MNFDDLKDRLKSDLQKTQERLEENSTFINLKDRFTSQNPIVQKLILVGVALVILFAIISIPMGQYSSSNDLLTEFETKRSLIRDLFKIQKEITDTPDIPLPPPTFAIKSSIESQLQGAQLLPEQMRGVQILPAMQSEHIKAEQNDGVIEVSLGQLNLRQIVDLGFQMQTISPSVKVKDLIIQASSGEPNYFDVIYRLLVLKVKPEADPIENEPKKKGKK